MTRQEVLQTMRAAQARVDNKSLPFDVRMRSRETVALCQERLEQEAEADNRRQDERAYTQAHG